MRLARDPPCVRTPLPCFSHPAFLSIHCTTASSSAAADGPISYMAIGLWIVRRSSWRQALVVSAAAVVLGLVISWLLYAPFSGWTTLPRMLHERSLFLANSPWQVLNYVLISQKGWPKDTTMQLTTRLPTVLFVVTAIGTSMWMLDYRPHRWRRSPPPDWADDRLLWRTLAILGLLYLLVGSFWFQHWYVLWALAPAALLPDSKITQVVLPWLSLGALSANVVSDFVRTTMSKGDVRTGIHTLVVVLIWIPATLAVVLVAGWQRLRQSAE